MAGTCPLPPLHSLCQACGLFAESCGPCAAPSNAGAPATVTGQVLAAAVWDSTGTDLPWLQKLLESSAVQGHGRAAMGVTGPPSCCRGVWPACTLRGCLTHGEKWFTVCILSLTRLWLPGWGWAAVGHQTPWQHHLFPQTSAHQPGEGRYRGNPPQRLTIMEQLTSKGVKPFQQWGTEDSPPERNRQEMQKATHGGRAERGGRGIGVP